MCVYIYILLFLFFSANDAVLLSFLFIKQSRKKLSLMIIVIMVINNTFKIRNISAAITLFHFEIHESI